VWLVALTVAVLVLAFIARLRYHETLLTSLTAQRIRGRLMRSTGAHPSAAGTGGDRDEAATRTPRQP
jgi:heme exporter protein D